MIKLADLNVIEELGTGRGVSTVRAVIPPREIQVVVKILNSPWLARPETRRTVKERLERWTDLDHPSILRPLRAFMENGRLVVLLPDLRTGSLEDRMRVGAYSALDEGRVMRRAGEALQAMHDMNIPHGNLKPGNLLFDEEGEVLLTDPNLCLPQGPDDEDIEAEDLDYRAPEQKARGRLTCLADQYSLALIGLTLIARQEPQQAMRLLSSFEGEHPSGVYRRSDDQRLTRQVAGPLRRALHVDPEQRYLSVSEFNRALQVALGYEEEAPRRPQIAPREAEPVARPRRRFSRVKLAALLLVPLLCVLGTFPALSSGWMEGVGSNGGGGAGGDETKPVATATSQAPGEVPRDPSSGAGEAEYEDPESETSGSLAAEWPQEGESDGGGGQDQSGAELEGSDEGEEQDQSGAELEGSGTEGEPTATETDPEPTATQETLATPTPTPVPTESEEPIRVINPNSCKSDKGHPRYCTPTPQS